MNKKGNLIAVTIILALILFAIVIIYFAQRECNSNRDCQSNSYCGTDFECHEYPQQIVVKETSWNTAAFIFGAAIIIAAVIVRMKL